MTEGPPRKPGRLYPLAAEKVRVVRCGRSTRCFKELAALFDESEVRPRIRRTPDMGPVRYVVVKQRDGSWGEILDPADPEVYAAELQLRCPTHGAMTCSVAAFVEAPTDLIIGRPPL